MATKIILCSVGLLCLIGFIIFIVEMCGAPEGYEDRKGFHVGKELTE